ncbi:MAG TPA: hypothetical protein VLG50_02770 [Candidatus Saccharimonadales bacterium]|nr:hypothetical protein [Candidatus Saccharimonadales bacterium]
MKYNNLRQLAVSFLTIYFMTQHMQAGFCCPCFGGCWKSLLSFFCTNTARRTTDQQLSVLQDTIIQSEEEILRTTSTTEQQLLPVTPYSNVKFHDILDQELPAPHNSSTTLPPNGFPTQTLPRLRTPSEDSETSFDDCSSPFTLDYKKNA